MSELDEQDYKSLERQLEELRLEHRDLDDIISHLIEHNPYRDQLQIQRLKKRKLRVKDMMARIESLLIPDLDA